MYRPTTRGAVRVAVTALVAGGGLLLTSVGPVSAAQQASNQTVALESAKPAAVSNAVASNAATQPTAADPVSSALEPGMKHVEAAHVERTPAGQVQDIVEFDSWAKNHLGLMRAMLDYEAGRNSIAGTAPVLGLFMQHMDVTHWNASPMEQASDIANFDSWNKTHLGLLRLMFDPFVGESSALGSSAGTDVLMKHMDVTHWNHSLNEQAAAIADEPAAWASAHQALIATALASAGSGHTPGR